MYIKLSIYLSFNSNFIIKFRINLKKFAKYISQSFIESKMKYSAIKQMFIQIFFQVRQKVFT